MRNILIFLLGLFALTACDLFTLRDPSPPSDAAAWNEPASTVELALQNLKYAYEDSRNAVNYSRIFHENYHFYFAAQDITDFSTPAEWNRQQEQDMLFNLHGRYDSIKLDLQPLDTPDELGANEAKIYRAYHIKAKSQSSPRDIDLAEGHIELHYKRTYDRWYLYKWKDYRASGASTWGRLKYENS